MLSGTGGPNHPTLPSQSETPVSPQNAEAREPPAKQRVARRVLIFLTLEQETQRLLDELKGAINQALLGSNRFAQILDLLEEAGHNVSVSVDATIDRGDGQPGGERVPAELNLTAKDRNFLHEMKIDADGANDGSDGAE